MPIPADQLAAAMAMLQRRGRGSRRGAPQGQVVPKSPCGLILLNPLDDMELVRSDELISEVFRVISRSKLDRYAPLERRLAAARVLIASGKLITLGEVTRQCRDPMDDHILQLAVDGKADYIVTGDQDLLVLNPFADASIVTPTEILS